MMKFDCDYWKPRYANPKHGCKNCVYEVKNECSIKDKVKAIYSTAICHGVVPMPHKNVLK